MCGHAKTFKHTLVSSIFSPVQHNMQSVLYAIARPSVCLSPVTRVDQSKWFKLGSCNFHRTVAQSLPCLRDKDHQEITGSAWSGASKNPWGGKTSHFLALCVNITKTVRPSEVRPKLLSMINRKLHMRFQLAQIDDLAWLKSISGKQFEFSRNLAWFRSFGKQQRLNEWR